MGSWVGLGLGGVAGRVGVWGGGGWVAYRRRGLSRFLAGRGA